MRLDNTALHIGKNKQLFFDNMIIEAVQDLTRIMHRPQRYDGNPIMQPDKPWEHVTYFSCCTFQVLLDAKDGLFKCLYADWDFNPSLWNETRDWTRLDVSHMRECYAYSEDGVNWIKPACGIVREGGHDTNIVWGDRKGVGTIYCNAIVADPHEADGARRFKTLFVRDAPGIHTIEAGYSGDFIHWHHCDQRPTFGYLTYLNDVLTLGYDPYARLFILHTRNPYQAHNPGNPLNPGTDSFVAMSYPGDFAKMNKRRIWQCESADFFHWTQPALIFEPDGDDNLDDSFYGMTQMMVDDVRIGFVNVFHETSNTMDVQLAYTRDGKNWRRVGKRQPWLCTGQQPAWDPHMVTMSSPPIVRGDEMWFFHGMSKNHHDWWMTGLAEGIDAPEVQSLDAVGYYLGLAKLRLDGFFSLDTSPYRQGILVTHPIFAEGNNLVINASCSEGGCIVAEMTDVAGKPLPGLAKEDCDPFAGDGVSHTMTWKGKRDFDLPGYCKLRFHMRRASLYSLQFVEDPELGYESDPQRGWNRAWRKWA